MSDSGYYQQAMPTDYASHHYAGYHQAVQPVEPVQPQQSPAETYLSETFPNVDRATVTAVLVSTGGEIDPAFHALSAISKSQARTSFAHSSTSQYPAPTLNYEHPAPPLPPRSPQPPQHQPSTDYFHPYAPPPPPYYHEHGGPTTPQPSSSYLSPTPPVASYYQQLASPNLLPQAGSTTPMYPPASPNLGPVLSTPSQLQAARQSSVPIPDIGTLSLTTKTPSDDKAAVHWASCDGCSADPIKGKRWRCLACSDYDLCHDCKEDGIHNHHRFEQLRPGLEVHHDVECDGCKVGDKAILGVRYACQKHHNEDWCEKCVKNGTACGGPYEEHKQSDLGRQIEEKGCLPMPQNWIPYLRPAVATYNIEDCPNANNWLEWPPGLAWFNVPKRDRQKKTVDPVFKIEMKQVKGHMISDHKMSWTLRNAAGTKLYTYAMEQDRKTYAVKSERFGEYKGKCTGPIWKHGPQIDCLSFHDPKTGAQYVWLSNRSISTLNDERFDFQRNALFEKKGGKDILVADFAWWDGLEDPEDCLTIRDPHVDHALVMASLVIVHDHQWQIMNEENERDPDNVYRTQGHARLTVRGRLSYWHSSDLQSASPTVAKPKSHAAGLNSITHTLSAGAELGNAISNVITASNGGGGS